MLESLCVLRLFGATFCGVFEVFFYQLAGSAGFSALDLPYKTLKLLDFRLNFRWLKVR